MERKLASIQRVLALEPIPNADVIELAKINGWQCVVKKGEFQVGDLGVFLEIDSIPPDSSAFKFLWAPKDAPGGIIERPAKFRLRTVKLRGALSQGLLLPLSMLGVSGGEGDDLTARLGVEKYEPPLSLFTGQNIARGPFPSWLPKTDEMRVQSVPEVLGELTGSPYVCTLKCDGTSATYTLSPFDGELHVCSRNLSLLDGDNVYWRLARELEVERVLRDNPGLAIQGEVCGSGIQKNRLELKSAQLLVFNVYDVTGARFLNDAEMRVFCAKNGLTPVEVIERSETFYHTQETLLALAEGKYPRTKNEREGIVVRPQNETFSPALSGRLSFKAISNRFLLKDGD